MSLSPTAAHLTVLAHATALSHFRCVIVVMVLALLRLTSFCQRPLAAYGAQLGAIVPLAEALVPEVAALE